MGLARRKAPEPKKPKEDSLNYRWLIARSKENLTHFYQKELTVILKTGKKPASLRARELSGMVRYGLITIAKTRVEHFPIYGLTPYSIRVLSDLELLKMTTENAPIGLFESASSSGLVQPVTGSEMSLIEEEEVETDE